jgi:hypothetical protein
MFSFAIAVKQYGVLGITSFFHRLQLSSSMTFTAKYLCNIKARIRLWYSLHAQCWGRGWLIFILWSRCFVNFVQMKQQLWKLVFYTGVDKDQDVWDMTLCQQALEAASFSKTSSTLYQLTWCYNPNDLNLHKQRLTVQCIPFGTLTCLGYVMLDGEMLVNS